MKFTLGNRGPHAVKSVADQTATCNEARAEGSSVQFDPTTASDVSTSSDERPSKLSRRSFLTTGAVVAGTTAVGVAAAVLTDSSKVSSGSASANNPTLHLSDSGNGEYVFGGDTVAFDLDVQAGITTPMQAHLVAVAFDIREGLEPQDARRLMRVLTQDIAALTSGKGGVADSEPELAQAPSNLTVTVGVGPRFFAAFGLKGGRPGWLVDLPAYRIDQLEEQWCGGDLLLQICGDDQIAIAHARKVLMSQTRRFVSLRWLQTGFSGARGATAEGTTMRNLMGQVDGTVNPDQILDDSLIFVRDGSPWEGASSVVVRRIAMNLETWEEVDRVAREDSLGRAMDTGAPLGQTSEHDDVDFDKTSALGFPLVSSYSHVRRARSDVPGQQIYRRAFNYDDAPRPGSLNNTGLVFVSYQASIENQYMPIQARLAELDSLNEWTTPIGSAVFAVLPGLGASEYLGQSILEPLIGEVSS